jgi:hypothetical protein
MNSEVKLRALTPLRGDYGNVPKGALFVTSEARAAELAARGMVVYQRERPLDLGWLSATTPLTATARKAGRPTGRS